MQSEGPKDITFDLLCCVELSEISVSMIWGWYSSPCTDTNCWEC